MLDTNGQAHEVIKMAKTQCLQNALVLYLREDGEMMVAHSGQGITTSYLNMLLRLANDRCLEQLKSEIQRPALPVKRR